VSTHRSSVAGPYLVPFDDSFRIADAPTAPPDDTPGKKELGKELDDLVKELADLQRMLYAHDHYSVLLVFQAMDAAGKDSTIRHVFSGVNPAGFQVFSFKQPSSEELDHDFLWRTARRLPERGRIGVFNRSYYEEVLVVKVHPEYLGGQRLPEGVDAETLWAQRYESIRDHEEHLARSGTVVVKFFLNVSRDEQRQRFLSRLAEPEKNWKFATGDVRERGLWDSYMSAYQDALAATSRPWAPWYAVPADDKPFMRLTVARIVADTLRSLPLRYPEPAEADRARFDEMRRRLENE
jgi:PPK2 family polyphosphate:nucleotide phosphotransferase